MVVESQLEEGAQGLSEVQFNLSFAGSTTGNNDGSVIMNLEIKSDTPGAPAGEELADKNNAGANDTNGSREWGYWGHRWNLRYSKTKTVVAGIPFLSNLPIIGALFRSTITEESQTEFTDYGHSYDSYN